MTLSKITTASCFVRLWILRCDHTALACCKTHAACWPKLAKPCSAAEPELSLLAIACILTPSLRLSSTKCVAFLDSALGSASSSQPHKCNNENHPVPGPTMHKRLPDAAAAPPTARAQRRRRLSAARAWSGRRSPPPRGRCLSGGPTRQPPPTFGVHRVYGAGPGDLRGRAAHVVDRCGFCRKAVGARVSRAGPGGHDLGQHDDVVGLPVGGDYRSSRERGAAATMMNVISTLRRGQRPGYCWPASLVSSWADHSS